MDATELTFAEALAGKKLLLLAIGLGSFGVVEVSGFHLETGVPLLILAFGVWWRSARGVSASRSKLGP